MKYVLSPREYDSYPLNWGSVFQRQAPLAIEIGFGNGEFIAKWAALKPEWNFVGIERSIASIERLHKRIVKAGINNIRILFDDASFALRELFEQNSVHHIVMNYPDPWPKDRHSNRRFLKPSFLEILATVIIKDGLFEIVTDQQWFAEDAFNFLSESEQWFSEKIEINPERSITTKYERKWQSMGRDSYRVFASNIKSAKTKKLLEKTTMPHRLINHQILPNKIFQLKGIDYSEGEIFFVIKDIFKHNSDSTYLVKTITKDSDYQQKFYVLVKKNKNNWLIKLDDTNRPYRTRAVKAAVNKIGEFLSGN